MGTGTIGHTGKGISRTVLETVAATLDVAREEMRTSGIAEPLLSLMVGNPIAQVKAPALLNPRFESAGLPVRMVAVELPVDDFEGAFAGAIDTPDVVAAVITVPFKFRVAAFCRILDGSATLSGAVNLMTRGKDGIWTGAMTDGIGFVAAVKSAGFDPAGKTAFMAGAGGAGSGIGAALKMSGLSGLDVYDPDRRKVERLETALGARGLPEPPARMSGYDLLINATPQGLKAGDPMPFDPTTADRGTFVGDVIAEPEFTRLRRTAGEVGLKSIGGMEMLNGQLDALYRGVVSAVLDNTNGAAE